MVSLTVYLLKVVNLRTVDRHLRCPGKLRRWPWHTEWVLPEHAELFNREGITVLGKRTESGDNRAAKVGQRRFTL